jgi:type VII secretion protein EccB
VRSPGLGVVEGRAVQSRRDQLQAYRFVNRRALAALVSGEPDVIDPPMRRLTITTISGIMIAILIAVGFALLGVIKPSQGDKWKAAGSIIVERETAARYIYVDNVLHPVLNYSSAVLAVSTNSKPKVVFVDRSDLKNVKRGPAVGIDGVPDSLPSAKNLIGSPWTVCSRQSGDSDQLNARVSVTVGSAAGAQPVAADRAVVVRSASGGTPYLLWQGQRLAIGSTKVAASLSLQTAQTVLVGTAFLDAIPPGPALRAPTIPSAGQRWTTSVSNRFPIVGQLLHITDEDTYYVVLADGVAPVNLVQKKLLETLPIGPNRTFLPAIETPNNVALNLPQSPNDSKTVATQFNGLPATVPPLIDSAWENGGICATYPGGSAKATFGVPATLLPAFRDGKVVESVASSQGLTDDVVLGPGRAALVKASDGSATVFVVAEPGKKFAVTSADVLTGFGYDHVTPVALPVQLLPMLPTGPALDPAAARRQITG